MHPNYTSHSSSSRAAFPTLVFKGEKTEPFILSMKLLNFSMNHPRPGLRVIWNMVVRNERTFPVDPSPRDAGTRPILAELLCSRSFSTCLTIYVFSFTRRQVCAWTLTKVTLCLFIPYLMVIWKYTGNLYFVVLKGHSRFRSAILPELTKKKLHYDAMRLVHAKG